MLVKPCVSMDFLDIVSKSLGIPSAFARFSCDFIANSLNFDDFLMIPVEFPWLTPHVAQNAARTWIVEAMRQ